jgi:hypothetical protein
MGNPGVRSLATATALLLSVCATVVVVVVARRTGGGDPSSPSPSPPAGSSHTTLVFQDEFDDFDVTRWQHEITAGGGGNWEFQWYTNNRSNSWVEDGVLNLKPTLTVTTTCLPRTPDPFACSSLLR